MAKHDKTLERLKRQQLVDAGAYDGRFVTKIVESEKRKQKKRKKIKLRDIDLDKE